MHTRFYRRPHEVLKFFYMFIHGVTCFCPILTEKPKQDLFVLWSKNRCYGINKVKTCTFTHPGWAMRLPNHCHHKVFRSFKDWCWWLLLSCRSSSEKGSWSSSVTRYLVDATIGSGRMMFESPRSYGRESKKNFSFTINIFFHSKVNHLIGHFFDLPFVAGTTTVPLLKVPFISGA